MTTFNAIDPSTGIALEPAFTESTAADVDAAFQAAERAFAEYSRRTPDERATFLRAIATEIESVAAELTARAQSETALPTARLEGERGRTTGQLRLIADTIAEGSWVEARIDRGNPRRTPLPKPDVRRMLVALGPVAVFGASNFPLAFGAAGGDTASALAAGCTVVYKAHPAQPETSRIIADAIARAARACDMPSGVFSMVHGWSNDVGVAMVRHPLATAVGFTGSLRGGRALFDVAAARSDPIPVYAEMGSVNPVFVFPSVVRERLETFAAGLAQSVTQGVGQFCTNPGVVVVVRDERFDTFVRELATRISAVPPGVPLYDRLGAAYTNGVARAQTLGAKAATDAAEPPANTVRPALLVTDADAFVARAELREEIFGPSSLIVAARDVSEFERIARAIEGQLTATIHASPTELREHATLVTHLERKAGRLIFNGFPTGVEVGHAMQHGGPYPASSDARTTSVGTASIARFARPVCFQDFPSEALPAELRDENARGIWRMVDGALGRH